MANISNEIVAFANGNTDCYVAFADYHNHKAAEEWGQNMGAYDTTVSLADKSAKVRTAYFAEMERLSNCKMDEVSKDAFFANPVVKWVK